MPIGNDIVDLREAIPLGKEHDSRFLERVFTPLERVCIRNASSPPLALWLLWAAKESLFKVKAKLEPGALFAHRNFSLAESVLESIREASQSGGSLEISDAGPAPPFQVRWCWNPDYVHCTASTGEGRLQAERVMPTSEVKLELLSPGEEESVHSQESRKVRLLAKALIQEYLNVKRPEIVRRKVASRFLPPLVLERGVPLAGVELSLSHDGRYVAAVISY